jgi:hypothetical protein
MMLDTDEIDEIVMFDPTSQETTTFVRPQVEIVDGTQANSKEVKYTDPSTTKVEMVSFHHDEYEDSSTLSINSPDMEDQTELPWDLSADSIASGRVCQIIQHGEDKSKEIVFIDPKSIHGATPVSEKVFSRYANK